MLRAAVGGTGGQRPGHLRLLPGGAAPGRGPAGSLSSVPASQATGSEEHPCRLLARLLILGPRPPGAGRSLPALPGAPCAAGEGGQAGKEALFHDRGQSRSKPYCLPTGQINTVWEEKKNK